MPAQFKAHATKPRINADLTQSGRIENLHGLVVLSGSDPAFVRVNPRLLTAHCLPMSQSAAVF